jgi:hypothetical protein
MVNNILAMTTPPEGRIATLWHLAWNNDRVRCAIYQSANGMQLRLESEAGTLISAPFEMQPKMFARTRALRDSLKRKGWTDV